MASERLQKILAQVGIASRRKSEEMIQEGLVTVNGKRAQIGDKAEWGKDAIKVNGKLLHQTESLVYLVFNKPKGVISMMSDPEDRPNLSHYLKKIRTRVYPIGRLDFNSEGLILLTNDGTYAEQVQKRKDILRVYSVKVKGHPDSERLTRLERGARVGELKKKLLKPHSVRIAQGLANKSVVEVSVLGGGAFDVKFLFDSKGFLVEKVVRTAIGHITLKGLLPGHFKYLKTSQAYALLEQPELGIRRHQKDVEKATPTAIRKIHPKRS